MSHDLGNVGPPPRPDPGGHEVRSYRLGDQPDSIDYPIFPIEYGPLTTTGMDHDTIVYAGPEQFVIDRWGLLFVDSQAQFGSDKLHPGRPNAGAIGLLCVDYSVERAASQPFYLAGIRRMAVGGIKRISRTLVTPDMLPAAEAEVPDESAGLFLPISLIVARDAVGANKWLTCDTGFIGAGRHLAAEMDQAFDGPQLSLGYRNNAHGVYKVIEE